MKVIELNTWDIGSTGRIMLQIAKEARKKGFDVKTFSNKFKGWKKMTSQIDNGNHIYYGSFLSFSIQYFGGSKFGLLGFFSVLSTLKLIYKIKKYNADLIHLHNLHDYSINIPLLFKFLKKHHIPVIWTLHDCWSFTGRCPYFDLAKCDRWKNGCHDCPYPKNSFPRADFDVTHMMWKFKRRWFTGLENCTLVTPSQWLADLVKKSYLKNYPVKVINNGIDLSLFKPTESEFREQHGLVCKKIVLGVAFGWGARKGLDVFIELSHRLPDDYQIILVGTNDIIDKQLPSNIISVHRTQNQKQLAEIYTTADVFANPTREEVFGLVNVEALACGTPVVTFKSGGSPECIDESCGAVVDCDDINAMEMEICRICEERPYSLNACIMRAKVFDMNEKFKEYVKLYEDIGK